MVRSARPRGLCSTPFGLCLLVFTVTPTQIGYQDVAALIARQPAVTAHWRQHVRASAFGTIHAATFSFSLPVGTNAPQPLSAQLASLDPRVIMPWSPPAAEADDPPLQFPKIDRSAKGDRQRVLNPQPRKPPAEAAQEVRTGAAANETVPALPVVAESGQPSAPTAEDKPAAEINPGPVEAAENPPEDIPDPLDAIVAKAPAGEPVEPAAPMAAPPFYFGDAALGRPDEELPNAAPATPVDPDIKLSALDPSQMPAGAKGGESIAPKGEVTGEGKRPLTPAERLKLEGKNRASAEKCLADAIYFESRGEAVRGQIAVAQVVMNRVFSGYYPRSVCGTVYQNKHRRLACQFTFACDGIPDTVTEPHAWLRATRIARDVLDGKYWLPEVDRATHYHAYWVRPSWVREMKRLYKFGVHTFYRPRAWGDGGDTPSWGTAEATREAIAKL
jgi:spore germination cell wall hydrolase CwlJ-like protein